NATPSRFFRCLDSFGALEILFPELWSLRDTPAGPAAFHGNNTAFDHTMEAIDRCRERGHSFSVFIAVLCHDFGKAVTPREVLPHHYGHEFNGIPIVERFLARNRFDSFTNRLALFTVENHMRIH